MIALGIESTAHTLGIGVVNENCDILANVRDMFKPPVGKGFIPSDLAEHHINMASQLLSAVKEKVDLSNVDVIAFSKGMGIPNALKVGAVLARYLSRKYDKPLLGVNHGVAHIEIGKAKTSSKDPVVVYLSGGNSQILAYLDGRYRVFGETLDIPVGNAFDVLAREMNLQMPGGPEIEKLALKGSFIDLPYTVKGMDMSFSGLLTAASDRLKNLREEDIAYSFQEISFSMLSEVTERALAHTGKNEVLLVGGVSANKRLQEIMNTMCEDRNAEMHVVPQEFSGDNGIMIGWNGVLAYESGRKGDIASSGVKQDWRTDDVEITWIR